MPGIATLTLNPALDISTTTEQVVPNHKMRCGTVQRYAGGGGINVARVLHRLGTAVQARLLVGGAAGAQLQQLLANEGIATHCQPIAEDTRENLSVVETTTAHEYRFILPGPTLQAVEWQACLDSLKNLQPTPSWLVASGGLPPGAPTDFYAQLAHEARSQRIRLAVDTSGPPLAAALQAGVHLVKPSLRELRDVLHQPLNEPSDWRAAAQALVRGGQAEVVALSAGEHGAVLATRDGLWQAPALPVFANTGTTGAGDCFLGALVWAMDRGNPPPEALRWAVAAGTAALLSPGTALAQVGDIRRLAPDVAVQAF